MCVCVGGGSCGLQLRVPVPNPSSAAAVDVHNAVDFAAALHILVKGWTECKNAIDADPQAGCVSYQQDDYCVIFSCSGTLPVQFVKVNGLPPSFIGAEHAQQVRRDAREMKPDLNQTCNRWLPPPQTANMPYRGCHQAQQLK